MAIDVNGFHDASAHKVLIAAASGHQAQGGGGGVNGAGKLAIALEHKVLVAGQSIINKIGGPASIIDTRATDDRTRASYIELKCSGRYNINACAAAANDHVPIDYQNSISGNRHLAGAAEAAAGHFVM